MKPLTKRQVLEIEQKRQDADRRANQFVCKLVGHEWEHGVFISDTHTAYQCDFCRTTTVIETKKGKPWRWRWW